MVQHTVDCLQTIGVCKQRTVCSSAIVVRDGARAEQPAEEGPERRDLAVHRRGADTSLLGTVGGPFARLVRGDAPRVERSVVAVEPRHEPFDVAAVVADGERRVAPFGLEVAYEFR